MGLGAPGIPPVLDAWGEVYKAPAAGGGVPKTLVRPNIPGSFTEGNDFGGPRSYWDGDVKNLFPVCGGLKKLPPISPGSRASPWPGVAAPAAAACFTAFSEPGGGAGSRSKSSCAMGDLRKLEVKGSIDPGIKF